MLVRTARKLAQAVAMPVLRRAARGYVAGPELHDGIAVCREAAGHGSASTLSFWNDSSDPPDRVLEVYRRAIQHLSHARLDCHLAIKATAFGLSSRHLAQVLSASREGSIRIHLDAMGPESADPTIALVQHSLPHAPGLGFTLPGRWRRSIHDADEAVRLGLRVRVVKGQWADPGHPDSDLRGGFLRVIDRLAGRAAHVAVASHDSDVVRKSLRRLRRAGTSCELELLHGLPVARAIREARAAGVPVRIYVPFGHAWLPYSLGAARKNPRVVWWLVKDGVSSSIWRRRPPGYRPPFGPPSPPSS